MTWLTFYKETDFKEISIGEIPEEWNFSKLSNLVEITTGRRSLGGALSKGTAASIGGEHIDNQGNIQWGNMKFIPSDFYDLLKEGKVSLGDILLVKDGATTGKVALVQNLNYEKVAVNEHVFVIRSIVDELKSKFLFYFLFSRYGQIQIRSRTQGMIGGLGRSDLEKVAIPLPHLQEQMKIVDFLSVIDLVIQKTDRIISKTERIKKGLMHKLLTKGRKHNKFKDTVLGRIPFTWKVKRLEDVCTEITIGVVSSATPYYTEANDGVPYFRSQNVKENSLKPTRVYVKKGFNASHPRSILKENDILTVQTGVFTGLSCMVPRIFEGANCHSLLITRTKPRILNPEFLCHFLNSEIGKNIIRRHNSGWARDHLLLADLRRIKLPIPPIDEQHWIAGAISSSYKKVDLEEKEKARLERIKQGLMDLLLSGKIRARMD